jgi:copper chaperone CopZ
MASIHLSITGMHCVNCQKKVEQALKRVPGTFGAMVDLEQGQADVDFDPAKAAGDQYVEAVKSVGYQAVVSG